MSIFSRLKAMNSIFLAVLSLLGFPIFGLSQGSQTRGPRAACGPQDVFVRPATSLKLLKLLIKLRFL